MRRSAGRLTAFVMSSLMASPKAFRHMALRGAGSRDRLQLPRQTFSSSWGSSRRLVPVPLHRSASMLGVEAGFGIAGVSALGAIRLLNVSLAPKRVRVVTDIDDTVKSSGNKRLFGIPLGGIDAQYSRGTFYPAVFQFTLELSRYCVPSWQEPLPVAVLTARAREFLFALEIGDTHEISRGFRLCGERNGLKSWGRGPVLYGSVKEWICPSRKSERKAKNFRFLLEDDWRGGRGRPSGSEGGYVFIGDTGEGDPRAGEIMCSEYPDRMRAIFLHVVSDAQRQGAVSVPVDRMVNGIPVVYFRTYVGAAVKAVELGLMDKAGLENVINAAKEALVAVPPKSSKWVDVNRDIEAARTVRPSSSSTAVKIPSLASRSNNIVPKTSKRNPSAIRRRPLSATATTAVRA